MSSNAAAGAARFVLCVRNRDYPASLELRKVYRLLKDEQASKHRQVRVIDESGEDYLYPEEYFVPIKLPQAAERAVSRGVGGACSKPGCSVPALVLSDPPLCPAHLADLALWVSRVEEETDNTLATLAREQYLVLCEEFGPVSGFFYHKVSGEPPPGVRARVEMVLAFCALAAASGVVGNLAYDLLKGIVVQLIGDRRAVFEEKITAELYEGIRTQVHGADALRDNQTSQSVRGEVELRYRLLVERRRRRR